MAVSSPQSPFSWEGIEHCSRILSRHSWHFASDHFETELAFSGIYMQAHKQLS